MSDPPEAVVDATWSAARACARDLGQRLPAESVDLVDADRRVLAETMSAMGDLPGFDSSAMDGWAVRGPGPWTVVGSVHAGEQAPAALLPGTAVRIATGAPTPAGTDGIVRSEHGSEDGSLLSGTSIGDDIRRAGQECRAGDVLARSGTDLSPALLGLVAAAGHDHVQVTTRPRASLLLLGDELQWAGVAGAGRVRDALGPQIPAWLARAGAVVVERTSVPDSLDALGNALREASGDVIVTTGGTAAGPRDHLRAAITDAGGRLVVDQVRVRPGHPMLLAAIGPMPVVALPGNPQAAVVALLTLGIPLIDALLGRTEPAVHRVVLAQDVAGRSGHQRLVAGVIGPDGFRRAPHDGSAMLRGLAASTGYAVIPESGARAGDQADWLALP